MAGFLRKKTKPDPKLKQFTPSPVDNNNSYANGGSRSSNSPTVVTPLYARFATSNASVARQDYLPLTTTPAPTTTMPSSSSGARLVVSGPMSLASASARRVNHVPSRVMTNGSNNGSAADVRSQRLGMMNNGSASGSGFFAGASTGTGASSPYSNTTPNASQFNFQASRQNSSNSNSNANGYAQGNGPGTTSRVSLDKPLPSPVGAGFVGADSPPMGYERRVSVDKPLPVPISQQQQYAPPSRALQQQQQQQQQPSSGSPIRRKDTTTTMNNARYPNDLVQHFSSATKSGGGDKRLPSQPPPEAQLPLTSNINTNGYENGYGNGYNNTPRQQHTYPLPSDPPQFSTPRTPPPVPLPTRTSSHTNYPNTNPNINQAPKPPSPTKKAQFPSLTRLSLSRSKSPPKPPSPTKLIPTSSIKHPPPSSTKRASPAKLLRSRSNTSSSLAASGSINKSLISRPSLSRIGAGVGNDPGYGERGRGGTSLDSVNKSGYVPSTPPSHSPAASISSRPKRVPSQSTAHTHSSSSSSRGSSTRKPTNHPQTTFGDFWLPPAKQRRPSSASSKTSTGVHTSAASPTEQRTIPFGTPASHIVQSPSSYTASPSNSLPTSISAHTPYRPHQNPTTNANANINGLPSTHHNTTNHLQPPHSHIAMDADPSVMSSPLVIHEELKEYSDLIQNVGAIGMSPAPAPALALAPESEPPIPAEQVKKGRAASGSVAVARQTSIQMRKGPLIFNTTSESGEAGPAQAQARPTPHPVVMQQQQQIVPNMSQKPNFVPPSGGLDAYPSPPPTEFSPLMDESIARQPAQKPSQAELQNHLASTRAPAPASKPEHQIVNFSVPRPVGAQPQQQLPSHQPQVQNQTLPQPAQIPRRKASLAQSDSQPRSRTPQTLLRSHHDDTNTIPPSSSQGLLSFDAQPKPHPALTKIRQASPATPPTSPKKSARRLDSTGELRDRGRVVSSSARGERPEIPKFPVMNTGDIRSSQADMGKQADFDPVATKLEAKASVDVDTDSTNLPPSKAPPTPVSPEERSRDHSRRGSLVDPHPSPSPPAADTISPESAEPREPGIIRAKPRPMTGFSMTEFSLTGFLSDAGLLYNILGYLSFYDWLALFSLSKQIRIQLEDDRDLREEILERYLETIGYERWGWDEEEALSLTLRDLHEYMRGVSLPSHQYARLADQCLQLRNNNPSDKSLRTIMRDCTASTIAYTRVVIRLRLQAEAAEADYIAQHIPGAGYPVSAWAKSNGSVIGSHSRGISSRASSRAPSPAMSMFSQSHHGHSGVVSHATGASEIITRPHRGAPFRSPLFKLRRAPLLRVFVPSPDGDWLSDSSVLDCEAQLKRAGVMKLLRTGDVVWDVAVGDEGNIGRMIWDGNFLIDLDYTYSRAGDLPQYLHTLAFSPSYFHRVIRTSPANSPNGSNPIVHINISPWGEQIAANLQLLQDRMRSETPQGSRRNVVRWVHRSSFVIRPPPAPVAARYGPNRTRVPSPRIAIPNTDSFVDPGWYGTVVVEAEGTNEGLMDLQERCGTGVFPPRAKNVIRNPGNLMPRDGRKVFRLLREKSRPGEIWLRAVVETERLM